MPTLTSQQIRNLVASRYLNASTQLFNGLKQQADQNHLHFAITIRSFIEYSRRGIWFLFWASDAQLVKTQKFSFADVNSPSVEKLDLLLQRKLGIDGPALLSQPVAGIGEPFIKCLHALTHGNPITVRMFEFGIDKLFDINMLLVRAEADLDIYRIAFYRHLLGQSEDEIWGLLREMHNRPNELMQNAIVAAYQVREKKKSSASEWPFVGYFD